MKRCFKAIFSVIILISVICGLSSCSLKNPVVLECNGLSIDKSTFILCVLDEAVAIYNDKVKEQDVEISKEKVIEMAKEKALEAIKHYTYYKQGYTKQNYKLSDQDSGEFRASVLNSLIEAGLEYESSRKDEIFLERFGVTFEQYMIYREEYELASIFYNSEVEKIEITEEEMIAFFQENKREYATCRADIILLNASADNVKEISEEIKSKMYGEYTMSEIKSEYKDIILKGENLGFDTTSNLDDIFGEGFLENIFQTSENNVVIMETDKGVVVAKVLQFDGYEDNIEVIKSALKNKKYVEFLEEVTKSETYSVEIIDEELFNSITIPI